jgi:hypothetical protein
MKIGKNIEDARHILSKEEFNTYFLNQPPTTRGSSLKARAFRCGSDVIYRCMINRIIDYFIK